MVITLMMLGTNGVARYYTLHDRQPLLTSKYALTVSWRVGNGRDHDRTYGFDTIAEMDKKIRQIFTRKIRAGYTLLYSFVRQKENSSNSDFYTRIANG